MIEQLAAVKESEEEEKKQEQKTTDTRVFILGGDVGLSDTLSD